jgi:hypothetical protein
MGEAVVACTALRARTVTAVVRRIFHDVERLWNGIEMMWVKGRREHQQLAACLIYTRSLRGPSGLEENALLRIFQYAAEPFSNAIDAR